MIMGLAFDSSYSEYEQKGDNYDIGYNSM